MTQPEYNITDLPYKIAVLCYLYDADGKVLLMHRKQQPNLGRYSPIGGKLEVTLGEGPHDCAVREIHEETGIKLADNEVRLTGIVSETAYQHETHWLMFCFEVMRPIAHDEIEVMDFEEGTMEWIALDQLDGVDMPETDRKVIWPLINEHRNGFFMVHFDCSADPMTWTVQESIQAGGVEGEEAAERRSDEATQGAV